MRDTAKSFSSAKKLGFSSFFSKLKFGNRVRSVFFFATAIVFISLSLSFILVWGKNLNSREIVLENEILKLRSSLTEQQIANGSLASELTALQTASSEARLKSYQESLDLYRAAGDKQKDYQDKGVDTSKAETGFNEILTLILDKKLEEARLKLNQTDTLLESLLTAKLEEEAKKKASETQPPTQPSDLPGSGYGRITAVTSRGNFLVDVVKVDLNSARVITDSATENDCNDNCSVKPLAQYVAENNGFAAINGTYFCPADYPSCAGKVNSFDFGLFNTRYNRWINATTLFWNSRAMFAFDGSSNPYFFREANSFGNVSDLKAAVVNYPALVSGGTNVLGNGDSLNDYLRLTKSTRSGLGVKGKVVYLVVARAASVPDLAEIFISLEVDHALNLDGGGSSALFYNGRYLVGPGRNLPNAIVFSR